MRTTALSRALIAAALVAGTGSAVSCNGLSAISPQMMQNMNDMADALNTLRQDSAIMQGEIDSLRTVVAKQDTTLRNLQLGVTAALSR